MLFLSLNKRSFANALKQDKNMVTYCLTTVALMLILFFHGLINGNLKPVHFLYALVVSALFCLWAVVDHKCRKYFRSKGQ